MATRKSIYFAACSCATSSYLQKDDDHFRKEDPKLWEVSPRFMNENDTFYHKDVLFSAAHHFKKYPDLRKQLYIDKKAFIFIDSGGYQLASGALTEKTWNNKTALDYSEKNGNLFPILDRPSMNPNDGRVIEECLTKSVEAAEYYRDNRSNSECSILNVLSAGTVPAMEHWYNQMKQFQFDGWAHGGAGRNLKSTIKGILFLLSKGEYDKEAVKFHHVFGVSGMTSILMFSAVQDVLNKMGIDLQLTFDSSYFQIQLAHGKMFTNPKWDGMGLIEFTNKVDYSGMTDLKLPCDCQICETVPSVASFAHPKTFYMKGIAHNLLLMDRIKMQADRIIAMGLLGQQRIAFGAKHFNNIQLMRKAFSNPKNGMVFIDKMDLPALNDPTISLDAFF